jgi:multimeric flavodoxin WrbA
LKGIRKRAIVGHTPSYAQEAGMRILGLSGSPRAEGSTAFAVRHALAVAEGEGAHAVYLSVAGRTIHPCGGCWTCGDTGKCVYDDDMTEIVEEMRKADGIVIGSPVYFGLVSSQLKTVMERCVVLRPSYTKPYAMTGKIGGGIACAGFRHGGQEITLQNIATFLMQLHVMAVSDGPGYSHSGAAIAGEAGEDTVGLEMVENLARNLVRLVKVRARG